MKKIHDYHYIIFKKIFIIFIFFILLTIPYISNIQSKNINISYNNILLIELDCTKTDGIINQFNQINCGPLPNLETKDGTDLTSQYREIGIGFVRTHDFSGPTDISDMFPNFSRDPADKNNYYFKDTDRFITAIINSGATVFFRLGESATTNKSLREPPRDFSKWAEICKHIIMHYNDGWADGFHYNISYFEIWNEADLLGFWNGTCYEYYELYKETVLKLKSYDNSIKIGGPCTSSLDNINFTHGFLTFIKENNLPIDFYSWHMYANNPYQLYNGSKNVRELLDSYGFYDTENINTEWNYNILSPQRDKDNSKNAAFTACALTSFQDSKIDQAYRYRGTQDNNFLMRFIGFDLSLFSYDGFFKTPALTYLAMDYLQNDSPVRLQTPIMDSYDGITYLGGMSDDKTNITIIISNFEADKKEYCLKLNNLPFDNKFNIVQYLIDDKAHFEIKDNIITDNTNMIYNNTIKTNSVHFIRITSSSIIPEEGPETAEIPLILKLKIFDAFGQILGILLMLLFFT